MKKLMMAIMLVVMMASMSLTAYAGESKEFKKVTEFYADEVQWYLPHAELSGGMEFVMVDDDYAITVKGDDHGTITAKMSRDDIVTTEILDVYVNGEDMMVFYSLDGTEYVETIYGATYAEEFYNRS